MMKMVVTNTTLLHLLTSTTVFMNNEMEYRTRGSPTKSWASCAEFLHDQEHHGGGDHDDQDHHGAGDHDVLIHLDRDGSLPPMSVVCELNHQGEVVTSVHHSNEEDTKVDGFQDKGSFHQVIHYHASQDQINSLLNTSTHCWQRLSYSCRNSRLFGSSSGKEFSPYGWWVTWEGVKMDYWGGASPGSRQCVCGVRGECHTQNKQCNCDSQYEDWLEDSGIISDKKHLPVKSLHFGDTGTPLDSKEGRFSLGMLRCAGPGIEKEDTDHNGEDESEDDSEENSDDDNIETTLATLEIYELLNNVVTSDVTNSTIVEHTEPKIAEHTEPSRIYPIIILSEELLKEEHDKEEGVVLSISSKFIVICIITFILFIIIIVFISYVHYCRKTKGEY